jgi:hypothetical protein
VYFQLALRPSLLLSIYLAATSKAKYYSFVSKGTFSVFGEEALKELSL